MNEAETETEREKGYRERFSFQPLSMTSLQRKVEVATKEPKSVASGGLGATDKRKHSLMKVIRGYRELRHY